MAWHLAGTYLETCSCALVPLLRAGTVDQAHALFPEARVRFVGWPVTKPVRPCLIWSRYRRPRSLASLTGPRPRHLFNEAPS